MSKIRGIFVPFVVPLTDDGEINEVELGRYLTWLIEKGVDGLYPNGSTSEFTRFTADERRRIVRLTCEVAENRVPVIAGAAEANVKETLAACECYQSYGARAVAVVSPFYYRLGEEAVYSYFRELALNTPIDITLYNIPMFASPISVACVERLAEYPRIVGIKDSSGDPGYMFRIMSAIRERRADFSFLTGWEPLLLYHVAMGGDGATHATAGVLPELTHRLFHTASKQDIPAAVQDQYRLVSAFYAMLEAGEFPNGFREGIRLRGFSVGSSRQPASPIPNELCTVIRDAIVNALKPPNG